MMPSEDNHTLGSDMSSSEAFSFLDHVTLLVQNLEDARSAFAELGFKVTPCSFLGEELGLENACVILEDEYIELTAVRTPNDHNQNYRDRLRVHGEGLVALAYRSRSARADASEYRRLGGPAFQILDFERRIELPDGSLDLAAFSVCVPVIPPTDGKFLIYGCQHKTPEIIWRHEWTGHENGAVAFESLAIRADSLSDNESSLQSLFGSRMRQEKRELQLPAQIPVRLSTSFAATGITLRATSKSSNFAAPQEVCGVTISLSGQT